MCVYMIVLEAATFFMVERAKLTREREKKRIDRIKIVCGGMGG